MCNACRHYGNRVRARTLIKFARLPSHHLDKPPAWAFNKEVVDFHVERGDLDGLTVYDAVNGLTWTVSLEDFLRWRREMGRNAEPQYFLTDNRWDNDQRPADQHKPAPAPEPEPAPAWIQPKLF